MALRHFDWKQVVFSLLGVAFAVGIVFLIIAHIGQQVTQTAQLSPKRSAQSSTMVAGSVGAAVSNADYQFFDLLDAPAPERDLPAVALGTNPAIEARRQQKIAARKRAKEKRAEARRLAREDDDTGEPEKPASAEPEKTQAVAQAPAPAPIAEPARPKAERSTSPIPRSPAVQALVKPAAAPEKKAAKPAPDKKEEVPEKKPVEKAEKKAEKKANFTVQVSAFKDEHAARALVKTLKSQGYQAQVKAEAIPGKGTWYRVRVGRFDSRTSAKKFQKSFSSKEGMAGFVTRY